MRLLPKSEIDKHKANERQAEIAEGLKLAKRVDSLRQTVAEEDKALKAFRVQTLEAIGDEIKAHTVKRDALRTEVKDLEERRAIALEPLDAKEADLRKRENNISIKEADNAKQEKLLHEVQLDLDKRTKDVVAKETQTAHLHEDAQLLHKNTVILNGDAERKHREAESVLSQARRDASVITENSIQREAWVQAREVTVQKKEDELRAQELQIAREWTLLRDRQDLLERNIKQHGS